MPNIPEVARKVPLMFRAQTAGRCQLQYVGTNDAQLWASEWIEKAYPDAPQFGSEVQTRKYTLSWRFITNSGQDDGVIRPVIGAKGWAFYPGSSMKGIFRRACTLEQAQRYCGKDISRGDFQPGILRFHGGYPTDTRWQENLVDIVHPQQDWQVKTDNKSSGAFVQISLYKPQLEFGISSTEALTESEWETIWKIWEQAFSTGIGCRVSAGYGQPRKRTGDILYRVELQGQGQASKLLDGVGEFRPNMFKAALRGHALRIFGGLTDAKTAESLVETLFGGVNGQGTVGLLSMAFRDTALDIDLFGQGNWAVPSYKVEGSLSWLLTQKLSENERKTLVAFIKALSRFAMLLGGFGKSWRRSDHRLFFPEYYDSENPKSLIGCHWQYTGERCLTQDSSVRKLEDVGTFINKVQQVAKDWMLLQKVTPNPNKYASSWREAWHPEKVQVWGRLASDAEECEAIRWLHKPYREALRNAGIRAGSIYKTSVTGQVGNIGRIWHRMYPVVRLVKSSTGAPLGRKTPQFLELITLFPDDSIECNDFLYFLKSEQKMFVKVW